MIHKTTFLGISIAAVFAIGMIASPIGVDAAGSFLDVKKTTVKTDSSEIEKANFSTKGHLQIGEGFAYGYGIISDAGLDAISVTTTHYGIQDSEAQSGPNDGTFHNHYVKLRGMDSGDWSGLCSDESLEVVDISFQEPGDVDIWGKKAVMEDVPYDFMATHSLSGDIITFVADENVGDAVSFTIGPVDKDGNSTLDPAEIIDGGSVCINDVAFVDNLKVREVNKFF